MWCTCVCVSITILHNQYGHRPQNARTCTNKYQYTFEWKGIIKINSKYNTYIHRDIHVKSFRTDEKSVNYIFSPSIVDYQYNRMSIFSQNHFIKINRKNLIWVESSVFNRISSTEQLYHIFFIYII